MQCRELKDILDQALQHESPNHKCEGVRYQSYQLEGECPYIGQQLLQKVSSTANEKDDDDM